MRQEVARGEKRENTLLTRRANRNLNRGGVVVSALEEKAARSHGIRPKVDNVSVAPDKTKGD